jgi:RNA polymerase sigma-70 factor (ECF subfamily)
MEPTGTARQLEQIMLAGRGRLLAFIQSRGTGPATAEDILQESLLKALQAAPALRAEEKFGPWFYQIIRNTITDAHRRGHREATRRSTFPDADVPSIEELDAEAEATLCACFQALIPTLKPEYATLIETMELGDEPPETVAARLGITRNNLKVRRHRARQQLRERLELTCRICAQHGCLDCTCRRP